MDASSNPSNQMRHRPAYAGIDPHRPCRICDEEVVDKDRWADLSGIRETPGIGTEARLGKADNLAVCDQAGHDHTLAACAEHRHRFVAAGGVGLKFDGLQLVKAARLRAQRILNVLSKVRNTAHRAVTEQEVRDELVEMAQAAEAALSAGKLQAFRNLIWPFGTPSS